MFQNLNLIGQKNIIWLVAGVLVAVALLAPAAQASEREIIVFTTLRTDIGTLVPELYQPSFLAKVEQAEQLLPPNPCHPPDPCHPPNPCASFNVLTALRNENQAVSGTNGYLVEDAAIIDADIAELLDTVHPPNPC